MSKYPCYTDLRQSPFKYEYLGLIFYFSSEVKLQKFKNNVKDYIEMEKIRLKSKYRVNFDINLLLCVSYYKRCESRGFRVLHNNKEKKENYNFNIIEYGKK